MKNVQDIIGGKQGGVFSIGPEATVFAVVKDMAKKSIGALLVMEEDDLLGILTERDYTRKVTRGALSASSQWVTWSRRSFPNKISPSTICKNTSCRAEPSAYR